MIINEANAKNLCAKEIYIHDDSLLFLNFDRNNKVMTLQFQKYATNSEFYTMKFLNVIGFSMTACDFWGASECVLDFEYVPNNDRIIIPQLKKRWEDVPNLVHDISYDDYVESLLIFSSGDQLRIACETIEIIQ